MPISNYRQVLWGGKKHGETNTVITHNKLRPQARQFRASDFLIEPNMKHNVDEGNEERGGGRGRRKGEEEGREGVMGIGRERGAEEGNQQSYTP